MSDQVARCGPSNPLLAKDLFVGRHDLLARLCALARQGYSVLLIGGRRAGKSTLVRQLTDGNTGRSVIGADASGWDLATERSALGGLRSAIEGRPQTAYSEATRDDVLTALQQLVPVVLVIDEADRVLQTAWCAGFFSFLRYLDDSLFRSQISIVLIGGPVLRLFRDPEDRGSPPLNTAEQLFLDPLDDPAVDELIALAARTDVAAHAVIDRADVMRLGGGHAFLTTRLLADVWTGQSMREAAESLFDRVQSTFEAWERQLGPEGRELYRKVPFDGVPVEAFTGGLWGKFRGAQRHARSIGVLRVSGGRLRTGTVLFKRWMSSRNPGSLTWDVAISYAAEDEDLARSVAGCLKEHFSVFFGPDEWAFLWGPDNMRTLPNTFEVECRSHLVVCTPAYARKHWTAIESEVDIDESGYRVIFLDCGAVPDTTRSFPVIGGWERLSPADLATAISAAIAGVV